MTRPPVAALLLALASASPALGLEGSAPRQPAPSPRASPVEEPVVTLEQLLALPKPGPACSESVKWAGDRPAKATELERASPRRFRLDYSRKRLLQDVPTQPERRRTDLGVTVRMDEADRLRLRGGVRVDEREISEDERESEATPTVGVEVRF